ncbi:MAG: hypothetical protein AAGD33_15320 [Actinomycetota bacterium]
MTTTEFETEAPASSVSLDRCPFVDGAGDFAGGVVPEDGPIAFPAGGGRVGIYGFPHDTDTTLEFIGWAPVDGRYRFQLAGNGTAYSAYLATLISDRTLQSIDDLVAATDDWDSPLQVAAFRSPQITDDDQRSLMAAVETYFDTENETGMMLLDVSADPDAPPPVDVMIRGLIAAGAPTSAFTSLTRDQMATALDEVWEDYRQIAATTGAPSSSMLELREVAPVEFASVSCLACKVKFAVLLGIAAAAIIALLVAALIASGGSAVGALLGLGEGLVQALSIAPATAATVVSGLGVTIQGAWIAGVAAAGAAAALAATIPRRICEALKECGTSDNEFSVIAGDGVTAIELIVPSAPEHEVSDARNWQGVSRQDDATVVVTVNRNLQESVAESLMSKVADSERHIVYCHGGNGIASKLSFWVKCQLIITASDGMTAGPVDVYLSQGERTHSVHVSHFWQMLCDSLASNESNNGGVLAVAGREFTVSQTGSAHELEIAAAS